MPKLTLFIFCILTAGRAYSDYLRTDCIGKSNADKAIVYLHGWDDPKLGQHEKKNRELWKMLAKKYRLIVALPRGDGRCSQGRRQCWRLRTKSDVVASFARLDAGAKECFGKRDYGVVGFSNGGYLVSGIYHYCLAPKASFLLAIGSAGLSHNRGVPRAECGPLVLQIGNSDITYKKAISYYRRLKAQGADSEFETFTGGHILHAPALMSVVNRF